MIRTLPGKAYFPPGVGDVILKATILTCSEGSSQGRMWCGELGMGWVKLDVQWCLTKEGKDLTKPALEKLSDSGACGFSDLCDSTYGEKELVDSMSHQAANQIGAKAKAALLNL